MRFTYSIILIAIIALNGVLSMLLPADEKSLKKCQEDLAERVKGCVGARAALTERLKKRPGMSRAEWGQAHNTMVAHREQVGMAAEKYNKARGLIPRLRHPNATMNLVKHIEKEERAKVGLPAGRSDFVR